jgi:hypothetical protein
VLRKTDSSCTKAPADNCQRPDRRLLSFPR